MWCAIKAMASSLAFPVLVQLLLVGAWAFIPRAVQAQGPFNADYLDLRRYPLHVDQGYPFKVLDQTRDMQGAWGLAMCLPPGSAEGRSDIARVYKLFVCGLNMDWHIATYALKDGQACRNESINVNVLQTSAVVLESVYVGAHFGIGHKTEPPLPKGYKTYEGTPVVPGPIMSSTYQYVHNVTVTLFTQELVNYYSQNAIGPCANKTFAVGIPVDISAGCDAPSTASTGVYGDRAFPGIVRVVAWMGHSCKSLHGHSEVAPLPASLAHKHGLGATGSPALWLADIEGCERTVPYEYDLILPKIQGFECPSPPIPCARFMNPTGPEPLNKLISSCDNPNSTDDTADVISSYTKLQGFWYYGTCLSTGYGASRLGPDGGADMFELSTQVICGHTLDLQHLTFRFVNGSNCSDANPVIRNMDLLLNPALRAEHGIELVDSQSHHAWYMMGKKPAVKQPLYWGQGQSMVSDYPDLRLLYFHSMNVTVVQKTQEGADFYNKYSQYNATLLPNGMRKVFKVNEAYDLTDGCYPTPNQPQTVTPRIVTVLAYMGWQCHTTAAFLRAGTPSQTVLDAWSRQRGVNLGSAANHGDMLYIDLGMCFDPIGAPNRGPLALILVYDKLAGYQCPIGHEDTLPLGLGVRGDNCNTLMDFNGIRHPLTEERISSCDFLSEEDRSRNRGLPALEEPTPELEQTPEPVFPVEDLDLRSYPLHVDQGAPMEVLDQTRDMQGAWGLALCVPPELANGRVDIARVYKLYVCGLNLDWHIGTYSLDGVTCQNASINVNVIQSSGRIMESVYIGAHLGVGHKTEPPLPRGYKTYEGIPVVPGPIMSSTYQYVHNVTVTLFTQELVNYYSQNAIGPCANKTFAVGVPVDISAGCDAPSTASTGVYGDRAFPGIVRVVAWMGHSCKSLHGHSEVAPLPASLAHKHGLGATGSPALWLADIEGCERTVPYEYDLILPKIQGFECPSPPIPCARFMNPTGPEPLNKLISSCDNPNSTDDTADVISSYTKLQGFWYYGTCLSTGYGASRLGPDGGADMFELSTQVICGHTLDLQHLTFRFVNGSNCSDANPVIRNMDLLLNPALRAEHGIELVDSQSHHAWYMMGKKPAVKQPLYWGQGQSMVSDYPDLRLLYFHSMNVTVVQKTQEGADFYNKYSQYNATLLPNGMRKVFKVNEAYDLTDGCYPTPNQPQTVTPRIVTVLAYMGWQCHTTAAFLRAGTPSQTVLDAWSRQRGVNLGSAANHGDMLYIDMGLCFDPIGAPNRGPQGIILVYDKLPGYQCPVGHEDTLPLGLGVRGDNCNTLMDFNGIRHPLTEERISSCDFLSEEDRSRIRGIPGVNKTVALVNSTVEPVFQIKDLDVRSYPLHVDQAKPIKVVHQAKSMQGAWGLALCVPPELANGRVDIARVYKLHVCGVNLDWHIGTYSLDGVTCQNASINVNIIKSSGRIMESVYIGAHLGIGHTTEPPLPRGYKTYEGIPVVPGPTMSSTYQYVHNVTVTLFTQELVNYYRQNAIGPCANKTFAVGVPVDISAGCDARSTASTGVYGDRAFPGIVRVVAWMGHSCKSLHGHSEVAPLPASLAHKHGLGATGSPALWLADIEGCERTVPYEYDLILPKIQGFECPSPPIPCARFMNPTGPEPLNKLISSCDNPNSTDDTADVISSYTKLQGFWYYGTCLSTGYGASRLGPDGGADMFELSTQVICGHTLDLQHLTFRFMNGSNCSDANPVIRNMDLLLNPALRAEHGIELVDSQSHHAWYMMGKKPAVKQPLYWGQGQSMVSDYPDLRLLYFHSMNVTVVQKTQEGADFYNKYAQYNATLLPNGMRKVFKVNEAYDLTDGCYPTPNQPQTVNPRIVTVLAYMGWQCHTTAAFLRAGTPSQTVLNAWSRQRGVNLGSAANHGDMLYIDMGLCFDPIGAPNRGPQGIILVYDKLPGYQCPVGHEDTLPLGLGVRGDNCNTLMDFNGIRHPLTEERISSCDFFSQLDRQALVFVNIALVIYLLRRATSMPAGKEVDGNRIQLHPVAASP
eukprot:jgi/Mesvir1/9771/Mv12224-RA.1